MPAIKVALQFDCRFGRARQAPAPPLFRWRSAFLLAWEGRPDRAVDAPYGASAGRIELRGLYPGPSSAGRRKPSGFSDAGSSQGKGYS